MAFTFDDFLQKTYGGNVVGAERLSCELGSVELAKFDDIASMFPGVSMTYSENVALFPFKICHSLPSVNKRKRCMTNPVLANSFKSFEDQMINMDHQIAANFPGTKDQIFGHIKAVRYGSQVEMAEDASIIIPKNPIPVYCLGVAYNRSEIGSRVIASHFKKTAKWLSSMECNHDWNECEFFYRGELIPLKDAEQGMLECIQQHTVTPYKGHELAIALGGSKGSVDFWGAALTETPADAGASVLSVSFGRNKELANQSTFYMPGKFFEAPTLELANAAADITPTELASIGVIGETEPDATDGHKHLILSDLTVFPTNGHSHSMKTISVTPGTKPTLSFVTSERYDSTENGGRYREVIHTHMGKIDLNKKYVGEKVGTTNPTEMASATVTPVTAPLPAVVPNLFPIFVPQFSILENPMKKSIAQLTSELASLTGQLATAATDVDRARINKELSALSQEIASFNSDQVIAEKVEATIAERIAAGKLVTSEVATAKVTEAEAKIKKENEDAEAARKLAETKLGDRISKIKGLGLDPDYKFDGTDEKPVTFAGIAKSISFDDAGDSSFNTHMSSWRALAEAAKATATAQAAAAAAPVVKAAEVASVTPVSKSMLLPAAGAGPATSGTGTEVANAGTAPAAGSVVPAAKKGYFGRSNITK
jgi:hypothetical protein